ncbi:MAG: TOBE domain-containing protein [Candidatus Rokuibacteriota bacterium]
MRGWIVLIVTLLVGAALGVAGTIYLPERVDPYLPKDLRLRARVVEGQVVQKQREGNRVLVKVQTDQGVILAAFTKRVAEIDLLVEPGATIALALPNDQPVVDDPPIERVKRPK